MKIIFPKTILILLCISVHIVTTIDASAQTPLEKNGIFDDTNILTGYVDEYREEPKEVIIGRINDDAINDYQCAAAIRVFKEKFSLNVFGREKLLIEQSLLRKINRSNSSFVDVEIMHTLCLLDRYRYYDSMVPALILKLDHYNSVVNEMAEIALDDIIKRGKNSSRDARIVFNTLRKIFFLSRNTFKDIDEPDSRLIRKLKILRWSLKILGAQEIKKLPKEMLHLL